MEETTERREEFRARLNKALAVKGLRAVDLCERTGIPKGAVSYYLSGKSQPKADRLYEISKALDISEAWLLGFDVPMERTAEQKKNDDIVRVVAQLRKDPDFLEIVTLLAELPPEQYSSLKSIILALAQK